MTIKWTEGAFEGGQLASVMAETMLAGKAREKFLARAGKPGLRKEQALDAFEKVYGFRPALELAENECVKAAYFALFESISDVWMLSDPIVYTEKLAKKPFGRPELAKLVNDYDFLRGALTGFELFGHDPSGDTCYVSTLPQAKGCAEVHLFNHENGEFEGRWGSIANFVARHFSPQDDEDDEDDYRKRPWGTSAVSFDKAFEKLRKTKKPYEASEQLYVRAEWLLPLPCGEPGYAFAKKLDNAPAFARWIEEKPLLAKHPVLANYWLLAHYFLGNSEACREAVALAKKSPGMVTPALAACVEALLDKPDSAKLGKLDAATLRELRETVAKNCPETLLDPKAAKALAVARAGDTKLATPKDVKARLAKGEDGWKIIAEFPDDVATHDLVLAEIGKKDKALEKTVKAYFSERTGDAYSRWPYRAKDYDRRFSPAVAAAFRSGLQFDADHAKAFPSLANTLAMADDDLAMDAFFQAIEKLAVDDPRLEYVIAALDKSKHARAGQVIERAALRFFETLETAQKRKTKKEKEGPTLDNMFAVPTYFADALRSALRRNDDRALALAEKTLGCTSQLELFGTALGLSVKVVTAHGKDHLKWITAYLEMVLEHRADTESVEDIAEFNLAECAIALAQSTDREKASKLLKARFDAKRPHLDADLALRSALLAGLLALEPANEIYLGWIERILANRTGAFRVHSALRAIEVSGAKVPAKWILPHVYERRISFSKLQTGAPIVRDAARRALSVIGAEAPPAYDDSDEFAENVDAEDLPAALHALHRHSIEYVFERIREKKYVHPDVVKEAAPVLVEAYAASADDPDRSTNEIRVEGLKAVRLQGPAALGLLASLLALPRVAQREKSAFYVCMRFCGQERAVRAWLQNASRDDVLAMLTKPTAEYVAFTDLLAAHAVSRWGDAARAACVIALEQRVAHASAESDYGAENEPVIHQLALVVASLGEKKKLTALAKPFDDYGVIADAFARSAKFEPEALTHDWTGAVVLSNVLHGDCKLELELALSGKRLEWKSRGEGINMNSLVEGDVFADAGTLAFATPTDAKTYADLELRAAALLGFSRPKPAKKAKGRK